MSDVAVAQQLIREAFPVTDKRNVKFAIWEAFRALKLKSERRAKAIWHGEARRIDHSEMTALQEAALKRARNEYAQAKHNIARLETALRFQNQKQNSGVSERVSNRAD